MIKFKRKETFTTSCWRHTRTEYWQFRRCEVQGWADALCERY